MEEQTTYFKEQETALKNWWAKSDILKVEFAGVRQLVDDFGGSVLVGKFNAIVNSVHIPGAQFVGYSIMLGRDGYAYILKPEGGRYINGKWAPLHRIKRTTKIL